jgi:hypothetical protein
VICVTDEPLGEFLRHSEVLLFEDSVPCEILYEIMEDVSKETALVTEPRRSIPGSEHDSERVLDNFIADLKQNAKLHPNPNQTHLSTVNTSLL